ncbi:MAG: CocE/NonD family hydrolase, partial [Mesorhizobium sp.]
LTGMTGVLAAPAVLRASRIVALMLATSLVWTGVACAQASNDPGLTEKDVYREHGYVRMKDGDRLAVVVWRPHKEGRYPVLLQYSLYGDSGMSFQTAKQFLEAGYAVVGATARGTGCSEGVNFAPYRPNEGPDGAQIVEWAGVQPWSTGNVGMIGNSNPAIMSYLVGAEQPPHLKAIVMAGASTVHDGFFLGGMFQASYAGEWLTGGQEANARSGAERRISWGDKECEEILASHKPYDLFYEMQEHPLRDAFWDRFSKERMGPRINVPTMIIAAFQDEYVNAVASGGRSFAHLFTMKHKKLVLTNGGHAAVRLAPLAKERIRWLDRWLKGVENGIDKEPPVTVFWEMQIPGADFSQNYDSIWSKQVTQASPGWTTTYANWPVPNLERTTFNMTQDAKLVRTRPMARPDEGARTYLYPSGTELPGSNPQFALTPQASGSLHYRTDPMEADMTLLGNPDVSFHFSSDQTDTDFMVTLKDVDPEGNTTYLTRGFLRASLRQIDPARTRPDQINQSLREVQELEPGKIYKARFSLDPIGHVVREGHRLEVSILAPNDIPSPVFASTPIKSPSLNKVYHSEKFPSKLVLPIVPGAKAQAPAPRCGTLWFQPCRKAPASSDNWQGGIVR